MTDRQITLAARGVHPATRAPSAKPRRPARYAAPAEVWARVRDDYLGGLSAPDCCQRHGVGLSALRERAAREGWRRADQPWTPPVALHSGLPSGLPAAMASALDGVEPAQVGRAAHRYMMQAVMQGDAAQALRWRRLARGMDEDQAAEDDAFDHQQMLETLRRRGG